MSLRYDPATMSTGFPRIDQQHQELIDHLNHLLEMMQDGRGQDELMPLVDFLADYADIHFRHEESCMARHACPVAGKNKEQHAAFLRMVESFRARLKRDGPSVALVLQAQRTLGQWVRQHIMKTDTHLRKCVGAGAGTAG